MMLDVVWIIIRQLPQLLVAAKALTLAIVSTSASASAGCVDHPFPYESWPN